MKDINEKVLATAMACRVSVAQRQLPHILAAMGRYSIVTLENTSAWLATLGHESSGFVYKKEIHDGSNYEGRLDLGNRFPGDGMRFPGRGWIQLTGRDAYEAYGLYRGIRDVNAVIAFLETDEGAADSAGWFWRGMPLPDGRKKKPWDLNVVSAPATWQSFYETQIRVNGKSKNIGSVNGKQVNLPNGWADRCTRWVRTWTVLE